MPAPYYTTAAPTFLFFVPLSVIGFMIVGIALNLRLSVADQRTKKIDRASGKTLGTARREIGWEDPDVAVVKTSGS
jgi:hypothetical protein